METAVLCVGRCWLGWGQTPPLLCFTNLLVVFLEGTSIPCVPQAGLVGPASVTFPVVASGEPVSVPDNLLKICKAKPVIFKGKYSCAPSSGGREGLPHKTVTSSQSKSKGIFLSQSECYPGH